MNSEAIFLTLRLALSTTAILLAVATPMAWWLAQRTSLSRAAVQAIISLPLVLPPTVIGFYLLVGLGPLHAPGRWIIRLLGHPLAFSFSGLLFGSVLYSLPFAVQPLVAGFQTIGPRFAEAAAMLGEPPWTTFRRISLPLARPAIVTAAVLTFMHTVGEFGVVLMLGGNLPGRTQTLSIALFDLVEDGRYVEANRLALILVALAAIALTVVYTRPQRALHD